VPCSADVLDILPGYLHMENSDSADILSVNGRCRSNNCTNLPKNRDSSSNAACHGAARAQRAVSVAKGIDEQGADLITGSITLLIRGNVHHH
jgi:hypothetical protein